MHSKGLDIDTVGDSVAAGSAFADLRMGVEQIHSTAGEAVGQGADFRAVHGERWAAHDDGLILYFVHEEGMCGMSMRGRPACMSGDGPCAE